VKEDKQLNQAVLYCKRSGMQKAKTTVSN